MSILKNIGRLFSYKIITQALMFIAVIVFTRNLSPSILGVYFYFESLMGMLAVAGTLGVGGSVESYLSSDNDKSEINATGFSLILIASSAAILLFYVLNRHMMFIEMRYIVLFSVGFISDRMLGYFRHVLRSELKASYAGFVMFVRMLIFVVLALLLLEYEALGLIVAAVVSRVVVLPISYLKLSTPFSLPSISKAIKLANFAKYYMINSLGLKVFYFADVIIIGLLLTKSHVGRYEVAWRIYLAGMSLNGVVTNTMFAYFSKYNKKEEDAQLVSNLEEAIKYSLILPAAAFTGSFAVGSDLTAVLFTSQYQATPLLMTILGFGFILQSLYFLFSRTMYAIKMQRLAFLVGIVVIPINICLNLVLIPEYELVGAALATTLSYGIATVAYYVALQTEVGFEIPYNHILITISIATVMGGVVTILANSLQTSAFRTISLTLGGAILYFGLLLVIPATRSTISSIVYETVSD